MEFEEASVVREEDECIGSVLQPEAAGGDLLGSAVEFFVQTREGGVKLRPRGSWRGERRRLPADGEADFVEVLEDEHAVTAGGMGFVEG
jgi:hypothetical protein